MSEDRRALYLRWRPLTFADVVGQEHVVRTLRNAIAAGAPAHAYLLAGPRGTGKTSVARILYRAVNCAAPRQGDPCAECHACRIALEGGALDLVEIDAASNRGIDDIRDLREKVAFSPSEMRYRVYIVDEAHELTTPAWDAFLKTLEEPPPHAIFVLATTEAHKVPATIVSRCQRFDFRRIKPTSIVGRLVEIAAQEGIDVEQGAAERLARMARGGLRDAISLLEQASSFTSGRVDLEALHDVLGLTEPRFTQRLIEQVSRGETAAALGLLVELSDSGADLRMFGEDLAGHLRGLLYASAGAAKALTGEFSAEDLTWIEREGEQWDPAVLASFLQMITDGLVRIRDAGQLQLHLELAVLDSCAASARPTGQLNASEPSETPTTSACPGSSSESAHSASPQPVVPGSLVEITSPPPAPGAPAAQTDQRSVQMERLDLDGVRQHWPRVIEWIATRNTFVASYLRPAELRDLSDGYLMLTFSFKVHYERVAESRNKALIEQACEQVLGHTVRLRCEHVPTLVTGNPEDLDIDDPVLKFALQRFGGRLELQ